MIKYIFTISLIICFFRVEAQTPSALTDTIPLNGNWQFKIDPDQKGEDLGWQNNPTEIKNWDKMEVPGNWDLHNEYAEYVGYAWYAKTFKFSQNLKDKHLRLVFESVYSDAEVWLNGKKLGENHFAFLSFDFDIPQGLIHLNGENLLVVKVGNLFKTGATWNWGGIRRPVWFECTSNTRINHVQVAAVPDLINKSANIKVDAEIAQYQVNSTIDKYSIQILYKNKSIYQSGFLSINASDNNIQTSKKIDLSPKFVHLWDFDHPELYDLVYTIYDHDKIIHQYGTKFGIRKIEVSGLKLLLNGNEVRPVGYNLVPEDRVTGNTLPFDRFKIMVDLMKSSGVNMARLSHVSLPKAFLDYLDEKGIMIFEEVALWGKNIMVDPNNEIPKIWLSKLVKQEFNHPAIIGWSVGNEIGDPKNNPLVNDYVKSAVQHAHQLDPNRLAAYVSNTVQKQADDASQYSDLILANAYGGWGKGAENIHQFFPHKPIFFSEFGSDLNNEDPNKSFLGIEKMLAQVRGKDYVIGASIWTFNDYRSDYWFSNPKWNTPSSQNRAWGTVNSFLMPKKSYYEVQKAYLPLKFNKFQVIQNNQNITGEINIQSRGYDDFPAYQMKGYSFRIESIHENGRVSEVKTILIPDLKPGDVFNKVSFSVQSVSAVKVSLLDPQNYSRFDSIIHFRLPKTPKLVGSNVSIRSARIVYLKDSSATYYTVKYGLDSLDQESKPSIDDFIDLSGLETLKNYKYQLVAHNNFGDTKSEIGSFQLKEDELPPVIWGVIAAQQSFFISFTSEPDDFIYQVAIGTKSGQYDRIISAKIKGVMKLANLISGQTYYFKLRRLKQWGFASEWTHEMKIKPF